ncbi:hypothetical protein [Brevundimonas lutea]|uniref:hypothetical protein n=1 Tax=Brevundimonas lutea TaxID=2293980 RepID=UPI0013CE51A1|nr:hypothetical protein [Brevundimonas lutea]
MNRDVTASWILVAGSLAAIVAAFVAEGRGYFPSALYQTHVQCPGSDRPFPIPVLDEFERDWYVSHLRSLDEPSLWRASQSGDGRFEVRFTWLRSFHPTVVVKVSETTEGAILVAKESTGLGGYDAGEINRTARRTLAPAELAALKASLDDATRLSAINCELGLDGAAWIIESRDAGNYTYQNRWSPRDGAVNRFGLEMIALTGWTFADVY